MEEENKDSKNVQLIKYQTLTGQEVRLSPEIVRNYLVSGEGKITDQEVMMFMALCRYQNLNPFLREAYLIKYGTEKATMVVGKETFLKRAVKNPKYRGHETSISTDGKKATAKVYVEGYAVPICCEVDYEEYVGRKKDGTVNRMWKGKGRTMLKKVALVQALREAFPEDFGGMYSPEEIPHVQELQDNMINMPTDDIEMIEEGKPPLKEPQPKGSAAKPSPQSQDSEASQSKDFPATDKQKRMVWARLKKVYGSDDEAKKTCIIVTGKESSKDWTNADVQNILEQLDLDAMLEDKDEEKGSAPTVLPPRQEKDLILDMLRSLATEPEHVDAMCEEGIGKKATDEWTAEDVDKMREYAGMFEKTKEAA